ncbi:DUF2637 domain-containing protein [Streptomyces sp. SBC-4]|nr:DUF2637 domain-containing protein [Streptomyces sp. SBC-4]MDV5145456.1 DUF2637 domain-containing protein [Streptomyces sp. SBC-4]
MTDTPVKSHPRRLPLRNMSAWDRAAIILLGATGFLFSYDALRQVAIAIHARPSLSYLFPVFIDGFIAYGVRALVLLRHSGFGARLYTWLLFLAATGSSLWANALHAITLNRVPRSADVPLHLGDSVVGVLSTLAPLALAGSVHLYIIMARTAESSVPDRPEVRPGPVREVARNDALWAAEVPPESSSIASKMPGVSSSAPAVSAQAAGRSPVVDRSAADPGKAPIRADHPHPGDVDTLPSAAREHSADAFEQAERTVPDGKARGGNAPVPPALESRAPSTPDGARPDSDDVEPTFRDGKEGSVPDEDSAKDETSVPPASEPSEAPVADGAGTHPDEVEPVVPDEAGEREDREVVDEWMRDLLPIAREASRQAGRTSRDAIKEAVRALQPISNDRLGELVSFLKMEEEAAQTKAADSPKPLW